MRKKASVCLSNQNINQTSGSIHLLLFFHESFVYDVSSNQNIINIVSKVKLNINQKDEKTNLEF